MNVMCQIILNLISILTYHKLMMTPLMNIEIVMQQKHRYPQLKTSWKCLQKKIENKFFNVIIEVLQSRHSRGMYNNLKKLDKFI